MNDYQARKVIGPEFFQEGETQKAFLAAYKGWVELCTPQRIKHGGCDGCPLDKHHFTGICSSFQTVGRTLKKVVPQKVRELKVTVSNLETKKGMLSRELEAFQEYMKAYACPGPGLFQSSGDKTT